MEYIWYKSGLKFEGVVRNKIKLLFSLLVFYWIASNLNHIEFELCLSFKTLLFCEQNVFSSLLITYYFQRINLSTLNNAEMVIYISEAKNKRTSLRWFFDFTERTSTKTSNIACYLYKYSWQLTEAGAWEASY
jgi:hypothetical protein